MKWLILVLLISCGQKNPPPRDLADSDGDQISNHDEASRGELEKYVAEITPFARTRGTLSFKLDGKFYALSVDNNNDIATASLRLLTRSDYLISAEDYFSELSLLHLEGNSLVVPAGNHDVVLSLESIEPPAAVLLTDGKAEVEVGKYAHRMEFRMSGEELQNTLLGKLRFKLDNAEDSPWSVTSTVRDRTYRVFYSDGKVSRIHYVSNELKFSEYLKLMKIHSPSEMKNLRGFSHEDTKLIWWTRALGKDRVVAKTSLYSLGKFNESNFTSTKSSLLRKNGTPSNTFKVKKIADTKFVLKIRASKTHRNFSESSRSYDIGGAQGDLSESCREWTRVVTGETSTAVTRLELLSALAIDVKGKRAELTDLISDLTAGSDAEGDYFEIAMDRTPEEFGIVLTQKDRSTYVKTGVYQKKCSYMRNPEYSGTDTNIEGQMVFKMESFIEKID